MATERKFPRWVPWWLLFIAGVAGAAIVGISIGTPDQPPAVLPDSTVEQETVDQSELVTRLLSDKASMELINDSLNLRLDEVTGELRTAENELVNIRTSIAIDTGPVAPPEPTVITQIVQAACEQDEIEPLGRIRANLLQFEGENQDGKLRFGWAGTVSADMSLDGGLNWAVLAEKDLTLATVRVVGTSNPEPPRASQRWSVGAHYSVLKSGQSIYDYSLDKYVSFDISSLRLYGARRWFPKKKITVSTGVFAERDTVGVTLGFDF